jgi:hypothetical protein
MDPVRDLTRACGNCGEDFVPREGDEAHAAGFCCGHCLNRHRGDDCPPGCPYCQDDGEEGSRGP